VKTSDQRVGAPERSRAVSPFPRSGNRTIFCVPRCAPLQRKRSACVRARSCARNPCFPGNPNPSVRYRPNSLLRRKSHWHMVARKFRNSKVLRASLRRDRSGAAPRVLSIFACNRHISRCLPHGKFLFSCDGKTQHVPIPGVQLRRHHLVRLLQPQFALQESASSSRHANTIADR